MTIYVKYSREQVAREEGKARSRGGYFAQLREQELGINPTKNHRDLKLAQCEDLYKMREMRRGER